MICRQFPPEIALQPKGKQWLRSGVQCPWHPAGYVHESFAIEATAPVTRHGFSQSYLTDSRHDSDDPSLGVPYRPSAISITLSYIPGHGTNYAS